MPARIVGWVCDQEWMDVYHKAFSGHLDDQQHAVDVIAVWRLRVSSRIPLAIEATFLALKALIAQSRDEESQKLIMSTVIIQFIGLVTERSFRFKTRIPMHVVGEDLGIPEWVVNLRHDISHGRLPSLCMLEKGVYFALEWLKANHWDVQAKKISGYAMSLEDLVNDETMLDVDEEISLLLQKYSHSFSNAKHKTKNCSIVEHLAQTCDVQRICVVFVFKGHYQSLYEKENANPEVDFGLSAKELQLWNPVINLIQSQKQLPTLLYCFVFRLCQSKNLLASNVLTSWCFHIIQSFGRGSLPYHKAWNEILRLLIGNVNCFTTQLYAKISPALCSKLQKEKKNKLNTLRGIFDPSLLSNTNKLDGGESSNNIYTLDDVVNSMKRKLPPQNDMVWNVYDGGDLTSYSIGLMPGQQQEFLSKQLLGFSFADCLEKGDAENGVNELSFDQETINESTEEPEDEDERPMFDTATLEAPIVSDNGGETSRTIGAFDSLLKQDWDKLLTSIDTF